MSNASAFLFYAVAAPVIISSGLTAAAAVAVYGYVRIVAMLRTVHTIQ